MRPAIIFLGALLFATQAAAQAGSGVVGGYAAISPAATTPYEIEIMTGQSNALNHGTSPQLISSAMWPSLSRMVTQKGPPIDGGSLVSTGAWANTVGNSDVGYLSQFPNTTIGFATAYYNRRFGDVVYGAISPIYLNITPAEGAQPLNSFLGPTQPDYASGHYTFQNINLAVPAILPLVTGPNHPAGVYVVWFIQGESGPYPPGSWSSMFETEYYNQQIAAIMADTGQSFSPKMLMWQTNDYADTVTPTAVSLEQIVAVSAEPNLYLVGPMYQFPLDNQGAGSTIHVSALGRLMLGDTGAYIRRVVRAGNSWTPVQIASASRAGSVITVNYTLPANAPNGAGSLSVDSDWVSTINNKGFVFTYNGASQTISTVTVSGSTVTITLSSNPGAHATESLRYAEDGTNNVSTWACCRGLIYEATTWPSYYYTLGFAVPQFIRLYAVRQIVAVS